MGRYGAHGVLIEFNPLVERFVIRDERAADDVGVPVHILRHRVENHVGAESVEYARDHGLRVAPQGTGHGAGAIDSLEDTLLVKTERMRDVSIDPFTNSLL